MFRFFCNVVSNLFLSLLCIEIIYLISYDELVEETMFLKDVLILFSNSYPIDDMIRNYQLILIFENDLSRSKCTITPSGKAINSREK